MIPNRKRLKSSCKKPHRITSELCLFSEFHSTIEAEWVDVWGYFAFLDIQCIFEPKQIQYSIIIMSIYFHIYAVRFGLFISNIGNGLGNSIEHDRAPICTLFKWFMFILSIAFYSIFIFEFVWKGMEMRFDACVFKTQICFKQIEWTELGRKMTYSR